MKLKINFNERSSLGTALRITDDRKQELLAFLDGLDKKLPRGSTVLHRLEAIVEYAKSTEEYTLMVVSDTKHLLRRTNFESLRREWMED